MEKRETPFQGRPVPRGYAVEFGTGRVVPVAPTPRSTFIGQKPRRPSGG
ncbi:MAG TPA: hypothetical protein VGK74_17755 [Symbiobacteriaceae bacterium]